MRRLSCRSLPARSLPRAPPMLRPGAVPGAMAALVGLMPFINELFPCWFTLKKEKKKRKYLSTWAECHGIAPKVLPGTGLSLWPCGTPGKPQALHAQRPGQVKPSPTVILLAACRAGLRQTSPEQNQVLRNAPNSFIF